jgi:hypothetical protein
VREAQQRAREQYEQHRRERRERRARRRAEPPPLPGARARRRGGAVGFVLMCGLLFVGIMAFLVPTGLQGGPATPTYVDAQPTPVLLYRSVNVPDGFATAVSLHEPEWVGLADQDLTAAEQMLELHLARMQALAPTDPMLRVHVAKLPSFKLVPDDKNLRAKVERFAKAREYDKSLAAQLAQAAPRSLAVAAQQLESIKFGDQKELERAKKLQRLLEETTGCKEIPLAVDPASTDLDEANEGLGTLWAWYLNEVGYSDRTWRVFQRLRGR